MVAYILPRKLSARTPQQRPRSNPPPPVAERPRSDPPPPVAERPRSDPPPPGLGSTLPVQPPRTDPPPAAAPAARSDPPPARPGSEPPGPMAPQRTVVLTSAASIPTAAPPKRSNTSPGGLEAPSPDAVAMAATALAPPPAHKPSSPPPAAPLFGSRPPPGAGSYSVSSSHPPPYETGAGNTRTSIERLKPLQSAHPPAQASDLHPSPAPAAAPAPAEQVIMSRPPALDPEAERWAARFESGPPPAEEEPPQRKRSARWKTQVMGSMVPLEVSSMREERPPPSDVSAAPAPAPAPAAERRIVPVATPLPPPMSDLIEHDVPAGWRPNVDPNNANVLQLRDAVLGQGLGQPLRIAVTGAPGTDKAQIASALALSLSLAGARVLLIEADFDRPQVHQALAIDAPSGAGFSQQILARRNARQPRPWVAVRCAPNLLVLVEGRLRSPGLLGSDDFERAISELAGGHHVMVIHAPALDGASDLRTIDALSQAAVISHPSEPVRIQFGQNPLRGAL
jgi:Mrp family chromosome partitioning ATPase